MQYLGTIHVKIDDKRRLFFPKSWSDETKIFFLVFDEYTKIYPRETWMRIMLDKKNESEKLLWSGKSIQMNLDTHGRLLLPKTIIWKYIDLIGMLDYIIIRESAV